MATSRSTPDSVNAVDPDVVIVVRTTEGGAGRVSNQTPVPATAAPRISAAAVKSATRRTSARTWRVRRWRTLNGRAGRLMAQHEQRRRDIANPLPRIFLEASPQQRPNRKGRLRRQGVPIRLGPEHRGERVADVLAVEGTFARQHLEQHGTEGPDVRAFVDGLPARLLRAHVRRGAENHPAPVVIAGVVIVGDCDDARRAADRLHRFRQAEVQHLHGAVRPDLDVRGLQIAMDDALLVRRFERLGDLLRDGQRLVERNRAAARCARRASAPRRVPSPARSMPSRRSRP